MKKLKPCFIVVDGGDGSGKDTQAKLIAKHYIQKGKKVKIRSHPAIDNFWGKKSKKALEKQGHKAHILAAFFYISDIIHSLITYYRHEDEVIIFVRYLLGVCYVPTFLVGIAYNFFGFLLPNTPYSFYIDVKAEESHRRITNRGEKIEMFETKEKLHKMRRKMRFIAKKKEWKIIDGNKSPLEVWKQIEKELTNIITDEISSKLL